MASASSANRINRKLIEEGVKHLLLSSPPTQSDMREAPACYEQAVEAFRGVIDQLEQILQPAMETNRNSSSRNVEEEEDILLERMEEVMHIRSRVHTVKLPTSLARTYFRSCNDHNPFVVYRRSINLEGRSLEPASGQNLSLLDSVQTALLCYNMGLTFHLCAIAPKTTTTLTAFQQKRTQNDDNLRSALKSYQTALKILTAAEVQHEEELKSFHLLWTMDKIDNCRKENASYDDDETSNNVQQFWQTYFLLRLALTNNITHIHAHYMNWTMVRHVTHKTVDSINATPIDRLFHDLLRMATRAHGDEPSGQMNWIGDEEEEPRNVSGNESVVTIMHRDLLKLWSSLERATLDLDTAPAA